MDASLPLSLQRRLVGLCRSSPFVLALIPFLLATVGGSGEPIAHATAKPALRPALAFDQYLVNLGPVELRQYHYARFAFTNTSDRTVKITDLKPSCGCLSPHLEKRTYQPQESGEFYLRVQTASVEAGAKEYTCQVMYDDLQPQVVDLRFKIDLPEKKVTVRPKAMAFYQFNGKPTTQEFIVTNYRSRRMEILDVESSSELVSTAIGEVNVDEFGNRQHHVQVTVGAVPPGRHEALLTITTDDPVFPELRVPIFVLGPETGVQPVNFEATAPQDSSAQQSEAP